MTRPPKYQLTRLWTLLAPHQLFTLLSILTQPLLSLAQTPEPHSPNLRPSQLLNEWQFLPIRPPSQEPDPNSPLKDRENLPWKPVELPASFEHHEGVAFDGIGWYRRVLSPAELTKLSKESKSPEYPSHRTILRFHAAATHATLFCNGKRIAEHLGGWTPFECDLTNTISELQNQKLQNGAPQDIEILVRVDERVGHNSQGFLPVFAPHFGGLWKPVELLNRPAISIDSDSLFLWGDPHESKLHYDVQLQYREVQLQYREAQPQSPTSLDNSLATKPLQLRLHYRLTPDKPLAPENRERSENQTAPSTPWSSISRIISPEELQRLQSEGTTTLKGIFPIESPKLWNPNTPYLYEALVTIETTDNTVDTAIDQVPARFAFRSIRVEKDQILLNDQPIQVRGILNWGYAPPSVAPSLDPSHWREELQLVKDYGFNLIKFCLWVPPKDYLHLADEMGVLVWMEYPTWHSQWTREALPTLEREFDEFFLYDRNHPSIILRSLTCETGPSADLDVIRTLYDRCHSRIPGSIVEDDSSWIQWNRIHDFYDDHPYGNNHTWLSTLSRLRQHIDEHGIKPLVLGEAIAADTWLTPNSLDPLAPQGLDAVLQSVQRGTPEHPTTSPFWFPLAYQANQTWAQQRSIDMGKPAVERLQTDSLRYAWLMRKYQIETYRREFPNGGYVVSVIRDFPFASMGLIDFLNKRKWNAKDFHWHSDSSLLLRTPSERRSFWDDAPFEADLLLQAPDLQARLESLHHPYDATSSPKLRLRWSWTSPNQPSINHEQTWTIQSLLQQSPSDPPSSMIVLHSLRDSLPQIPSSLESAPNPTPWNLEVELVAISEQHSSSAPTPGEISEVKPNQAIVIAKNHWDLWQLPNPNNRMEATPAPASTSKTRHDLELHASCSPTLRRDLIALAQRYSWSITESPSDASVVIAQRFDSPLIDALELGRNVLFLPDGQFASLPLSQHWFLRGGPILNANSRWEQAHAMLTDLQHFDLAGPVVPDIQWLDQCTPYLMLWDNHDIAQVKTHGLLFATQIGKGTLLVNTLNLGDGSNPAGAWVFDQSIKQLQLLQSSHQPSSLARTETDPPIQAMRTESLQALRDKLREKTIDLTKIQWKLRPDPMDRGVAEGWHRNLDNQKDSNDSEWKPIQIGKHWESQGYPGLDGWAWYQTEIQVPDDWPTEPLYLWIDGADDYIEVYIEGNLIGTAGNRETRKTAFEDRVSFKIPMAITSTHPSKLHVSIRIEDWQGAGGLFRPIFLATTPRSPKLQILP